jgi:hypothetical protein
MAGATFWKNSAPVQEPKRAYRWYISFGNLGATGIGKNVGGWASSNGALQYACKRVDRPSISVSETEHTYINHKFYYPGRVEWSEVSVSFVDVVGQDGAADIFLGMLYDAGYKIPTAADGTAANLVTLGKQSMIDALGDVYITLVNAEGEMIEKWVLHNAFFKSVRLAGLDYGSEEMLTVDTSIRYDYATYQRHGSASGLNGDTDEPNLAVKNQHLWTKGGA